MWDYPSKTRLAKTGFPTSQPLRKGAGNVDNPDSPTSRGYGVNGELYMSFELGDKSWKVTVSDTRRGASRYNVAAGDTAAVTHCIGQARERCKLEPQAGVHSCYEAGRDGWWLHRWLIGQGVDNIVVDSASIEVNRHARRAKTDRIDGDKLLAMLLRHHRGEPCVVGAA
jgi:transposase